MPISLDQNVQASRHTHRKPILTLALFLFLLGSLLSSAGCATRAPQYAVEINSLSSLPPSPPSPPSSGSAPDSITPKTDPLAADLSESRYLLLPKDPEVDARDLQHREFEGILEAALADRGMVRVDSAENADVALLVNYGIGDRETEIVNYSAPYHVLNDYRFYSRYPVRSARHRHRHHRRRFGGLGYSAYPYSAFNRGFFNNSQTRSQITVNRFLNLDARRIVSGEDPRSGEPLWSTEVRSRGPIDDLRRVFPILASAAAEHAASDTGQVVEKTISENDERVLRIRPLSSLERPQNEADRANGNASALEEYPDLTGPSN